MQRGEIQARTHSRTTEKKHRVEDVGMLFVFSLLNACFVCSGADHFATVVLQDCLRWAVYTMSQELVKQRSLYFTSDLSLCQLTQ